MMLLASAAVISISWPQLGVAVTGIWALIKIGDRLYLKARNGRGGGNGNAMAVRIAKLEEHAKNTNTQLSEIKGHLKTISDRLFTIGRER